MTNRWTVAAAAVLAAAMPAAAPQAQAPQPTIQQQFDAASAALAAENWAEALRQFEALEARLARGGTRNLAIVRVRKAAALLELGRLDEASEALRLGLPALPATDRSLDEDRFDGHVTLGRIAEYRFDYRTAIGHYRTARAIEVAPAHKVDAYRGLVQTQMFFDAPAALNDIDEGLRVVAAAAPGNRQLEGQYRTLRGRVLLNMGRFADARQELEAAMRLLGGLTLRVDLRDLIARSDLAIAAMLAGDAADARRYLAYTGAGRMPDKLLPIGARVTLPRCGGNGLEPDDVAVVEFSIRSGGTVGHARPIYSSKQGEAALIFARAVSRWWWAAEDIADIDPLFRAAIRVELRCTHRTLEGGEFPPDELAEIERWSASRAVPLEPEPARDRSAAELRTDLAALETRHGRSAPHLLVPLVRLGVTGGLRPRDRIAFLERAMAIAAEARVPSPYLLMIAYRLHGARREAANRDGDDRPDYAAMVADPALRGDPYVATNLHLADARWFAAQGRWPDSAQALAQARAVGLPADHPTMADLLEVTAVIETARGNREAAQAAWRAAPVGPRWCLIMPQRRAASVHSSDFPRTAAGWGFEGWTIVESLVGGRVAALQRTVVAYPPFVFSTGSEDIARRFRFEETFQPETGPCAVHRQSFRFELPR